MNPVAAFPFLSPGVSEEDDPFYEVVNGQRIEGKPMGTEESIRASRLLVHMGHYALTQNMGQVVSEILFVLDRENDLQRRPDLAYVSFQRWPEDRSVLTSTPWDVVPDLAIEFVSPSNGANEVLNKVSEYFHAGVRQVWLFFPLCRVLYCYTSFTSIRVIDEGGNLEGGDVLPGFSLPLASLFPRGADGGRAG